MALAGAAIAAATVGDHAASGQALELADSCSPVAMRVMLPELERARAWHLWSCGDFEAAMDHLASAVETAETIGSAALAVASLHDMVRLGFTPKITGRTDREAPTGETGGQAHSIVPADVVSTLTGVASRVDGPLAATRVAHSRALEVWDGDDLEKVGQKWQDLGCLLFAAEAFAAASAARRREGDSRRAARSANQSAILADRCEGATTPGLRLAGDAALLTSCEREVADLASTGLSSKTIASALGLSTRTVENHLQRAYTKLAISSRDDLVPIMRGIPPR